jgi:hypothetical protein
MDFFKRPGRFGAEPRGSRGTKAGKIGKRLSGNVFERDAILFAIKDAGNRGRGEASQNARLVCQIFAGFSDAQLERDDAADLAVLSEPYSPGSSSAKLPDDLEAFSNSISGLHSGPEGILPIF